MCTHRRRFWRSEGSVAELISPCRTGSTVLRVAGQSRRRSEQTKEKALKGKTLEVKMEVDKQKGMGTKITSIYGALLLKNKNRKAIKSRLF